MGSTNTADRDSLFDLIVDDGRPLLAAGALGLIAAGAFAFFLSATGTFLPHDLAWLGMTDAELRAVAGGQVADFMFHDRVAFGGTLVAVGVLYLWLVARPLRDGEPWAWRLLAGSSMLGFGSFLAWLGYGYLDTWHLVATVALLVLFGFGLWRTRVVGLRRRDANERRRPGRPDLRSAARIGRALLLLTGFGMLVAGSTILTIGSFVVFVPQDLAFLGLDRAKLDAISPRLVPLIAHDRSGFGGSLATAGVIVLGCVWYGRPSRALWQALLVAGAAGFGAAIGIHGLIGYLDAVHVGPAIAGAAVFAVGMALTRHDSIATRRPAPAATAAPASAPESPPPRSARPASG